MMGTALQVEVLMRLAAKTRDTAQRNAYEEFAEELEKRKKLAVFTVPVKAEKDVAKEKKSMVQAVALSCPCLGVLRVRSVS